MGPPLYMWFSVDQDVVVRHITVQGLVLPLVKEHAKESQHLIKGYVTNQTLPSPSQHQFLS